MSASVCRHQRYFVLVQYKHFGHVCSPSYRKIVLLSSWRMAYSPRRLMFPLDTLKLCIEPSWENPAVHRLHPAEAGFVYLSITPVLSDSRPFNLRFHKAVFSGQQSFPL